MDACAASSVKIPFVQVLLPFAARLAADHALLVVNINFQLALQHGYLLPKGKSTIKHGMQYLPGFCATLALIMTNCLRR